MRWSGTSRISDPSQKIADFVVCIKPLTVQGRWHIIKQGRFLPDEVAGGHMRIHLGLARGTGEPGEQHTGAAIPQRPGRNAVRLGVQGR